MLFLASMWFFFFFLCSQTPLVLLLLLILNNAPTRPLSQTWVSAVSPSQVDLSLPWLSFPNLPFPVMPRPGLRAPSLSVTATPSLVALPVSAVFHVATRTAFFMPGHGPLTNSGDTQMPPEKHLTPSVTIRTKGSCLYRNDCRVIQGCCFHFQPYFLPQPICHKELLTLASVCEALSQLLDFTPFFLGAGGDKNLSLIRCSWLPMSCRGLAVLDSPVGISGVPVSRSDLPLSPWGLTFSSAHSFWHRESGWAPQ